MSQLKIVEIKKKYKSKEVLKGVSLSVESGQVVGLLGPNGAGKTTCFYGVVGIISSDEGEILIDDQSVIDLPVYERARNGLSYLPQESSIFHKLTVRENILVALEANKVSLLRRESKLKQLLQDFQIQDIEDNYGYSLSGGGETSCGNS